VISEKPWKIEAIVRLVLSIFLCIFAGSVVMTALNYDVVPQRVRVGFICLLITAIGCIIGSLLLLAKPWPSENFTRRFALLLILFYAAMATGMWSAKLAGKIPGGTTQILIGTLSFQGAGLLLICKFLKEHASSFPAAFGFRNRTQQALLAGLAVAFCFLPLGLGLHALSAKIMQHMNVRPEEQQAVQVLRQTHAWLGATALGVVAIVIAPVAEEMLFRGIAYPALKQAGYPRLSLWVTALFFAAMHLNVASFVPLLVLALVLTFLYEYTDNLLACIVAHSCFNAMNFILFYLWQE
jgi:membrane protease YdiL (CAAX protease family)